MRDVGAVPVRPRRRRAARRLALVLVAGAIAVAVLVVVRETSRNGDDFAPPSHASLIALRLPLRIAAVAESQVGYRTDPTSTYCNKFSAFWNAGMSICPQGERSEEWCADFAAWAWRVAGVHVPYGYVAGEISGAAASFYEWGVDHGRWHPVGSGYVAQPGDVAVYGLSVAGADPVAAHVAIVTDDPAGQRGPDVVNGDGDRTGFSVVETGSNQLTVHADHRDARLSGYVSPP